MKQILCSRCQWHLCFEFLNWEIKRFRFAVTQPARPSTSHWIVPTESSLSGEVALVVAHLRLEQGAGALGISFCAMAAGAARHDTATALMPIPGLFASVVFRVTTA